MRKRLAELREKVGTARYRAAQPLIVEGAITAWALETYCQGCGLEIGPGQMPHGDTGRTVAVDKLTDFGGSRTHVNVVADARTLPFPDDSRDYLISSHSMEHHHDTLGVLIEWGRVVRPAGTVVLILPHVDRTFDRGRPTSDVAHHVAEIGAALDSDNPDHFADNERWTFPQADSPWMNDPNAHLPDGSLNRCWISQRGYIHYHCWTQNEMIEIVRYMGWGVRLVVEQLPERQDSFMIVAEVGCVELPFGTSLSSRC